MYNVATPFIEPRCRCCVLKSKRFMRLGERGILRTTRLAKDKTALLSSLPSTQRARLGTAALNPAPRIHNIHLTWNFQSSNVLKKCVHLIVVQVQTRVRVRHLTPDRQKSTLSDTEDVAPRYDCSGPHDPRLTGERVLDGNKYPSVATTIDKSLDVAWPEQLRANSAIPPDTRCF